MSGFKINFVLRDVEKIVPWGEEGDYMSWFGLTDADLWITFGDKTIYEYSDAVRKSRPNDTKYNNNYRLSSFIEYLTQTFEHIRESIPQKLYDNITEDIDEFVDRWYESHMADNDDDFDKFYDEEYSPFAKWFFGRYLDGAQLFGGAKMAFFRCGDMLKIRWNGVYRRESEENIWWTAPDGVFELPYSDFISEIRRFFGEFFEKMDEQVKKALEKDWGIVRLDKKRLAEEHKERREDFYQKIALLDEDIQNTDWDKIIVLFDKMMCTAIGRSAWLARCEA